MGGGGRIPLSVNQTLTCVVINCMTNKGMTNGGGGGYH